LSPDMAHDGSPHLGPIADDHMAMICLTWCRLPCLHSQPYSWFRRPWACDSSITCSIVRGIFFTFCIFFIVSPSCNEHPKTEEDRGEYRPGKAAKGHRFLGYYSSSSMAPSQKEISSSTSSLPWRLPTKTSAILQHPSSQCVPPPISSVFLFLDCQL